MFVFGTFAEDIGCSKLGKKRFVDFSNFWRLNTEYTVQCVLLHCNGMDSLYRCFPTELCLTVNIQASFIWQNLADCVLLSGSELSCMHVNMLAGSSL